MEENSLRRRYRSVALIATVAALALAYGTARHLSWASTKPTVQQVFSVTVDRDKAPWERPVIAICEGVPVHIGVHSREAGVFMAHEIPGALATCACGATQSLELLPAANGSPSFMDQGPADVRAAFRSARHRLAPAVAAAGRILADVPARQFGLRMTCTGVADSRRPYLRRVTSRPRSRSAITCWPVQPSAISFRCSR